MSQPTRYKNGSAAGSRFSRSLLEGVYNQMHNQVPYEPSSIRISAESIQHSVQYSLYAVR